MRLLLLIVVTILISGCMNNSALLGRIDGKVVWFRGIGDQ